MATEKERAQPWSLHSCRLCPYRSKSAFTMSLHVRLHKTRPKTDTFACDSKTPEAFKCEICDFDTDLKVILKEHVRVTHEGKETNDEMDNILKSFQCRNGDFGTHSLFVLTKHEDDCGNLLPRLKFNYECPHCPQKTKTTKGLKLHIFVKHSHPEYDFKCTQCLFKTKYERSLKRHILYKHLKPANINWFKCSHAQCWFQTTQEASLKMHILNKHSNPENIKCSYNAEHKSNFKNIDFKCSLCSFKTSRLFYLNSHTLRRHSKPEGIYWFKCVECPFETKYKKNLQVHISRKHLNPEFWLKCSTCSFKSKSNAAFLTHTKFCTKYVTKVGLFGPII